MFGQNSNHLDLKRFLIRTQVITHGFKIGTQKPWLRKGNRSYQGDWPRHYYSSPFFSFYRHYPNEITILSLNLKFVYQM